MESIPTTKEQKTSEIAPTTNKSSFHHRKSQKPKLKQHKLFVTGLPVHGTARRYKNRIADTFRNANIHVGKIKLGCNQFTHLKGFFYININAIDEADVLASKLVLHNEETEIDYPLKICKSIPGKVDLLFPSLTNKQRLQLKFDPTGTFSCSDEMTANLTTRISMNICQLASRNSQQQQSTDTTCFSVLDMFGCVGGNAISYGKQFTKVESIELVASRRNMLEHNVTIALGKDKCKHVTCIQGDGVLQGQASYHSVCWLDPPWGGLEYTKSKESIEDFEITSEGFEISMRQVIQKIAPHTDLIVYRLPNNFKIDELLAWVVDPTNGLCGDKGGSNHDRPLPFRMRMGGKCTLVLICLPASRANRRVEEEESGRLDFGLHNLDAIIKMLYQIDRELLKELRPKFWDWEMTRNIRIKDWKGVNNDLDETVKSGGKR